MSEIAARHPAPQAPARVAPAAGPPSPAQTEETEDEVIVHVYDDIREADNRLPMWWLYTLYGAIVIAIGYWFYYEVYQTGPSPVTEYRRALAAEKRAEVERLKSLGAITPEGLVALSQNGEAVREGKGIFEKNCVMCHAAGGAGQVGPNQTDKYWMHGGKPEQVMETVRTGVVKNAMPAWGPALGEEKVRLVVAYVLSLKNTNVTGGKAPQGKAE